ncbi:HupE/UreJ family protein [Prosthecomicrobium hirschii]|uniref:HupE/UreJ family protein n=1 Tax=Prosthecodimorpha hirschii TaxID=665126 RepID=UPI00221E4B4D|nr:HupE/UreJ family protein [Prosthecomicrobium hirschii]MCW1840585.1 HupE/UreJ family protein [Prosthecomicrobium hirschii]
MKLVSRSLSAAGLALAALPVLATAASAHPGHEVVANFSSGLAHPVHGADHVLAMVAVGLLAARFGGRTLVLLPAAFVTAMLAGGLAGVVLGGLPAVEPGILASIVVLGLAAGVGRLVPAGAALAITAVFAVFHGAAHGMEMPASGPAAAYFAGFALATALLHAAGIGLGLLASRLGRLASNAAGLSVAAAGIAMAAGLL